MNEFWEPWVPDVGERIRYVYKPECPGVYGMVAPVGHPPEYDRLEGVMGLIIQQLWDRVAALEESTAVLRRYVSEEERVAHE